MTDLLKAFSGGGLVGIVAWIFPSALVLGLFWLLVYPHVGPSLHFFSNLGATEKTGIFTAASIAVGLVLDAMSTPLYRLLEGYSWSEKCQDRGVEKQRAIKARLEKELTGSGWRIGLIYEKLSRFPTAADQIAPTQLGNALRAFETYGVSRFNLDSQTMWTELCSVVPKYLQDELDRSRATVDLFVALVYLSTLFGLVTLAVALVPVFKLQLLIGAIVALASTILWYRMAVVSSSYWSTTVQALVNLGRKKLAEEFGLQLPDKVDDEREMWRLVLSFVYFGNLEDGRALDRFRIRPAPKAAAATESVAPATGTR